MNADDDIPISLGLTNTDVTGKEIETFRCPSCKEYINSSMTKCRFCGAKVDEAALARARVNAKIESTCGAAGALAKGWWVWPAIFWAMLILRYKFRDLFFFANFSSGPGRFLWIPFIHLGVIGGLWRRSKALRRRDPALEDALDNVKKSFWLWTLSFVGPCLILLLVRPDLLGSIGKYVRAIL